VGEPGGRPAKPAEAFFPGDWFRPYDVGYLDEDGFLYYADRAGDKITSPAGAVFPHLIEAALLPHPAVANCGAVGLGPPGSQAVVAAILLKPDHSPTPTLGDEILAQTTDLPDHERPPDPVFVPAPPPAPAAPRSNAKPSATSPPPARDHLVPDRVPHVPAAQPPGSRPAVLA